VLREAEQLALADRDGPQLAGPVVDVAEDVAVERLQVSQVVAAGQRVELEFDQPVAGEFGFRLGEFGLCR
jgi:hypothetical protein